MTKKPEETPGHGGVKKQLESIVGHEIDAPEELLFNLWYPSAAHDQTDGTIAWRSPILAGRRCSPGTLIDASGVSVTGANGQKIFLLSDFICLPPVRSLAEPVNVLATPRSTSPFFVTTTHQLVNNGTDLEITVFAWDPTGAPAPSVTFDWRCRLVSNQIIG